MSRIFFLLFFIAALIGGYGLGTGLLHKKKGGKISLAVGIHPEREVAPVEYKSFAVVLRARNDALWIEDSLRSIFAQDYDRFRLILVDDGSIDDTFAKAQQFISDNQLEARVTVVQNEQAQGSVASLYRAAELCRDFEIMVPIEARDWLAVPTVLDRLNRAFQNTDVWAVFGQAIQYPEYQIVQPPEWDREEIEKHGYGNQFLRAPVSFYAALFRKVPLSSLFSSGSISSDTSRYLIPLLELSGGRFKSISEPLVFENQTLGPKKIALFDHEPFAPLSHFPKAPLAAPKADILLFSYDRPLQLYALLESIHRHMTGYEKLSVLYRASDERFAMGYQELKATFPDVFFIKQGHEPRKDFKPLVMKTVFDSSSEYILFGVDDMIVKDDVDLSQCMSVMEKTGAYGFYLRFGRHINHSYQASTEQKVPDPIPLSGDIYAWDVKKGDLDWGFANTVDMTLYRKKDLKSSFESFGFKTPTVLEFGWAKHQPKDAIGLYFERSKVVNIPLNVIVKTGNPHMNYLTPEELLVKFNQHLKFDIEPLYQVENPSPHYEYFPEFITR